MLGISWGGAKGPATPLPVPTSTGTCQRRRPAGRTLAWRVSPSLCPRQTTAPSVRQRGFYQAVWRRAGKGKVPLVAAPGTVTTLLALPAGDLGATSLGTTASSRLSCLCPGVPAAGGFSYSLFFRVDFPPSPSIPYRLLERREQRAALEPVHPREIRSRRMTGARSRFLLAQRPRQQKSWPGKHQSRRGQVAPDSLSLADTLSQTLVITRTRFLPKP